MGSRLTFRPFHADVITCTGTVEQDAGGHVDRPFKGVGQPRPEYEAAGQPKVKLCGADTREKPYQGDRMVSVP
jgi:hypothetical protein